MIFFKKSKYIVICEICGKKHDFRRCSNESCKEPIYHIDPDKKRHECDGKIHCENVIHENGNMVCNGEKDGKKCTNNISVPRMNRWLKKWYNKNNDNIAMISFIINLILMAKLFF